MNKLTPSLFKEMSKVGYNITLQTILLLTSFGLLYVDFLNTCQRGYSGQVEKRVEFFVIILQETKYFNYADKLIYLVVCF